VARLDRMGARPAAQRVRGRMRHRGLIVAPAAGGGELTAREREVLALLARGLSDKGIARNLEISPKTVGHHVSAVLRKLDASSRGHAAAIARETGLA